MKVRTILVILSLLSLFSVSAAGYFYYSSLRKSALEEANQEAISKTEIIAHNIASNLSKHQKSVKALAGLKELQQALAEKDVNKIEKANLILDHFHNALKVSVCYLMDKNGVTVASSNRKAPDSFVGKNYAFRHYFKQASQGIPAIYMALGVTSGKRGVYFSHPIYDDLAKAPSGIVIIKDSLGEIEKDIKQAHEGIMAFTGPHGVIFVTNHRDWLYHVLWEVSPEDIMTISKTRQFGKGPWNWAGVKRLGDYRAGDKSGIKYNIHEAAISNYPGWKVIYLHDLRSVIKRISDPLFKTARSIILAICLLVGFALLILYRAASYDIVRRKRAEESLKESLQTSTDIVKAIPAGLFIYRFEKPDKLFLLDGNPEAARLTGIKPQEWLGKEFNEIWPNALETGVTESFLQVVETGKTYETEDLYYKDKRLEGAFRIRAFPMPGTKLGVAFENIFERRRTEEALRESEERFRELAELLPETVFEMDPGGKITFVNRIAFDQFGYTQKDFDQGLNGLDMLVQEDRQRGFENIKRRLKGEKIGLREYTAMKKDGNTFPALINATAILREGKPVGLRGFIIDISEKKRLETQLQQALKMEAIGTLAGGIAHDFNNILGIILGNTELAMMDVSEWNPGHHNLEEIRKACMRAKDLVRQILSFSRQTEHERKPLSIVPIVKESLKLLRSSIPTTIEIRQEIAGKSDTVMADPTQLNQVLMNLCTNAAYAMRDEGGILKVKLGDLQLDEDAVSQYPGLASGEYVKLSVTDTGAGIDPDIMDRIFDPYFTTKEVGEGTGMGLAVAHGIVTNHKGAIKVSSEPGKGTAFEVVLPVIEKEIMTEEDKAEPLPTGNERILFIDDEPSITEVGKQMLQHLGYEVVVRTKSISALELFKIQPDNFDLVITDMTMPQMTGDSLAKELMKIRPDIPVILCTGYSERISKDTVKEMGIRAFVMKPIVMGDLANTIRKILDEKSNP